MSIKKLFLLDGHALVYRAHFAFITRPLMNSKGQNTSAITGFIRTLIDIIQNEKPTHIGVSFDLSGPTFRNTMYEPYKANREETPDDIRFALPYIKRIIEGYNIPIVTAENYEADDVIGTLAKKAEKDGFQVYMVTPDKDYGQLVSPNIFMYKPSRQGNGVEIWGEKEVCENWDIQRVDQVIDILGLQGDSVDNIPGIPGIGPKTAAKLLADFDTLENVLANADKLKGKQKEKVIEFAEQAILSKQLATIDLNVPIEFNGDDYTIDPINKEILSEVFKELEFRSLAKSILGEDNDSDQTTMPSTKSSGNAAPSIQGSLFDGMPNESNTIASHSIATNNIHSTEHNYHLATAPEEIKSLVQKLSACAKFCLDTETTDIDPNLAELVGMSFAIEAGEAWYVPVPKDREKAIALVAKFKEVLENAAIEKIGQNIKYDALVLKWYDVELAGLYFDTMVAHYLVEPDLRHNMDYLAETYLKYQPVSITSLLGKKGKQQLTMRDVAVEEVKEYAAEDADVTLQLEAHLRPWLEKESLLDLYKTMEAPLIKVLTTLEFNGIRVDADFLADYSVELTTAILKAEEEVYAIAGTPFNISSPKQVGEVMFDLLKIPYRWRKTKTGQYSTDEEKLSELAIKNPIADKILAYRSLSKLKSTYVDSLPKMINPKTGRVHSSFNQTVASTGRLSSNNPNLQNIPIRTEDGARIREAFVPADEEHVLMAADYSQIELRLIAEIANEVHMLEAFQAGQDIHKATAARIFGVPYDEVTSEQRYRSKTVNFSIIYGAGSTNLSRQLDIPRTEAGELIQQYFNQYPGLKAYMDNIVAEAREKGYVTTYLGRKRWLRDINSKSSLERSNAERMAVNSPIQGTAADMIKLAMIKIHDDMQTQGLKSKMILQVHDELVFDVWKPELDIMKKLVEEGMQNAIPGLKVPILVEANTGNNWREAH